jgi:hypothetical protein
MILYLKNNFHIDIDNNIRGIDNEIINILKNINNNWNFIIPRFKFEKKKMDVVTFI